MDENQTNKKVSVNVNEQNLGTIAHISGLFLSFLGPLVIYLLFKDSVSENTHKNIINSLNFNISMIIYYLGASLLSLVLIGLLILPVLFILNIVFTIIGTIEASKGGVYKYPLSIELIK